MVEVDIGAVHYSIVVMSALICGQLSATLHDVHLNIGVAVHRLEMDSLEVNTTIVFPLHIFAEAVSSLLGIH